MYPLQATGGRRVGVEPIPSFFSPQQESPSIRSAVQIIKILEAFVSAVKAKQALVACKLALYPKVVSSDFHHWQDP
jgi:hypothetical protein